MFYSTDLSGNELNLYTEQFPPFNYVSEGELTGINLDIVKLACERSNITCHLTSLPWNRAYANALKFDNSGVFSTSRAEQREANFLWVGPLVYGRACFYKLSSREDIQIADLQSVKQYSLGIPHEDILQKILESLGLEKNKHFITFTEKHEDTRMFAIGKLDLIIGSSLTIKSQLANVGLTLSDVTPVFELNEKTLRGNYLALNKSVKPEIIYALQHSIDQLRKDGSIQKIIESYIDMPPENSSQQVNLPMCLSGAANY